jgi:hypothetical protein
MPIVNTYYFAEKHKEMVLSHIDDLKGLVAEQLTCGDIKLGSKEVTIRLIKTPTEGMIAELEMEILAHAFRERVEKQDDICRAIRVHILKNVPELKDVRVWLALSELGHSW